MFLYVIYVVKIFHYLDFSFLFLRYRRRTIVLYGTRFYDDDDDDDDDDDHNNNNNNNNDDNNNNNSNK